MKTKFKNPLFWISLISIIFAAGGIDFESLTSWQLLIEGLVGILRNPVALTACVIAGLGVWNDNGTKGIDGLN